MAAAVAIALVVGVLGLPTAGGASGGAPRQDPQEGSDSSLKGEYDEVTEQETALVEAYEAAQQKRVAATDELARLKTDLQRRQAELLVAYADLNKALDTEARQVKARKAADQAVAEGEERLRQQIVASYVRGGEDLSVLDAMLSAENGEEAGQAVAFSRAVVGDSDVLLKELGEARAAQRKAVRAAKRARSEAKATRDEIEAGTNFVAAAADQQAALVDEVNQQVLAEQDALREVQSRKAVIESRINAISRSSDGIQMVLAQVQAGQPAWAPGDVEITNPIPGYRIGSKFGLRFHPILNVSRLHAGGDMGAPSGTTIYAPADGIVVIAGERGGYGNATVIDHGHSLATLYGHQSQILVQPGQAVKRGDPIGKVGSTGLSTGPHLHFETRIKGAPIDPEGVVDFSLPKVSYQQEAEDRAAAFGN